MQPETLSQPLLAWFHENKRILPFRTESTPYRVWVSEIMLQQTRVSAVLDYFERFMKELPTVQALAECPPDRLMKLWEGLGYYSRARNLQKAAQVIVAQYGGKLPADYKALLALPGIGEYTAGAIASISFGLPVTAVDGNVLRVFSRVLWDEGDILRPDTKKRLTAQTAYFQPPDAPGAYNEALMELGALVCLPNGAPLCTECPLSHLCEAHRRGRETELPHKTPKKARRRERYTALLILRRENETPQILLTHRPAEGVLAGLWQPVLLEGTLSKAEAESALAALGLHAKVCKAAPKARHIFTHLEWELSGWVCRFESGTLLQEHVWANAAGLCGEYALPNAVKAYSDLAKEMLSCPDRFSL